MRTLTEEAPKAATQPQPAAQANNLETFSTTLRDGRVITIREMTGKDLIFIEEELSSVGETRKSFKIIELLNVGSDKISSEEIESLGVRDIRSISDLVAKANGDFETEDPKYK